MRYKTLILFMVITVLMISAFSGCSLLPVEEQLPTMPTVQEYVASVFNEVSVQRGDLVSKRDVTVQYKALLSVNYQFDSSLKGQKIGTCHVEKGQYVQKGDLLLELDNESLYTQIAAQEEKVADQQLKLNHLRESGELEVKLQQAILAQKQKELQDVQALIKKVEAWQAQGSPAQSRPTDKSLDSLKREESTLQTEITRQIKTVDTTISNQQKTLDNAEATMKLLNTRMEELYDAIDDRRIYAEGDGVVTFVDDFVNHSTVESRYSITVTDENSLFFILSSSDAARFPVGATAQVKFTTSLNTYELVAVDPTQKGYTPEEGTAYFVAAGDMPTQKIDASGKITVILETREDVLLLPSNAVHTVEGKSVVYVKGEDGLRTAKEITIGLVADGYTEIVSGLAEGDKVIVEMGAEA